MLLIFDLDGTLIDSSKDLAIAMNATRVHMGQTEVDPALIYSYVGNGAATLVKRALGPGASEATVATALNFFLTFYGKHAWEHTHLYPGLRGAIEQLQADGHSLAVLTNKPAQISKEILAAVGLASYFPDLYGGDSLPVRKPDPAGIHKLRLDTGKSADETIMIGDSAVDVQTARNAGVAAWGVTWGFQPETFKQHPPDLLIDAPLDLLRSTAARSRY